ncbi:hypothetical protein KY284_000710 [Solanum tuberosum]|nr:hypothetical protein KY284_000710 [Solanum tuberosum]
MDASPAKFREIVGNTSAMFSEKLFKSSKRPIRLGKTTEYAYGSIGSPPDNPIKLTLTLGAIDTRRIRAPPDPNILMYSIKKGEKKQQWLELGGTVFFVVELVACRPRKGSSIGSLSDERAGLE